jgi:hypothetical protein
MMLRRDGLSKIIWLLQLFCCGSAAGAGALRCRLIAELFKQIVCLGLSPYRSAAPCSKGLEAAILQIVAAVTL